MNTKYEKFKSLMRKIADVNYSLSLLHWDQETYMPTKGVSIRAQQIGTLSGISHELFVSKDMGDLLEHLKNDTSLTFRESKNIELTLKDYYRHKKYSTDFVVTLNKTTSESSRAWSKAKETDDYTIFAPHLEKVLLLKKEECEILGYKENPYNALLDLYEPEAKVADLDILFGEVKKKLVPFVKRIAKQPIHNNSFLQKHYDKKKQWDFGIYILRQIGYDFEAGRQDITSHPFTIHFNSNDVRVTTRINENDFSGMIWSTIHEGGHALYEQGLSFDDYGLPSADSISLGIHESQSRLWENYVGRGMSFWKANYKRLQEIFPENLKNISIHDFYKGINVVQPSLIRVYADELTYHFHILIRYEIEKELIAGTLSVNDLPSFWNKKYKEYLNIEVPSNTKGMLQDIHWSNGGIGYFPTYSLGSFYAAQFYKKAKHDIGDLEGLIANGDMKPLLEWLRQHIHVYGKTYTADELCTNITGEKLNFQYFLDYAEKKFSEIYELNCTASCL